MLLVINKCKIQSMVDQFYAESGLADNHNPLKVTKLSVFTENSIGVGSETDYDDFVDEDYACDYEFSMVLDCYITDTFFIKPANVYTSNDSNIGIIYEWIPNKSLFVTSKADYIKLYESFVAYLETTQQICNTIHGFAFDNMELILCFSNLFEDVDIVNLTSVDELNVNPLFTKEHFDTGTTKIATLNAIFKY